LQRQADLVESVRHELARETVVFCTHPPVVTVGRATLPDDIFNWSGQKVEVSRGGRATYHGPNQLVVYPILDLNQRRRDLHLYMRQLEDAIVLTLAEFNIQATGRSLQIQSEDALPSEATGVWVGARKIASIGIGVRKWVSFHGLALNVDHDAQAFQGLKPCGFSSETMVSMEELVGQKISRTDVQSTLKRHLAAIFVSIQPAKDAGPITSPSSSPH
jgi:lipoyl(octanoyl) transferase